MLIDSVVELGVKLLDRVIPDPVQKAQAQLELMKLQQSGELASMTAQTDINKIEAANASLFVSGWRPYIGWTCGTAFSLHFLVFPIINFILVALGYVEVKITFDMTTLLTVLGGMLGIGGLRTIEKLNGVTK